VKSVFHSLRGRLGKVGHLTVTDPITQLILGVLSRDTPESRAGEGLDRLRGMVVDYNELRVIPPIELANVLHDFPDHRLKCEDISRALNGIFALEHTVSLERVSGLPRKDQLAYLEKIDGLDPYTRARIRLLGLRLHAIPLDEAMWAFARAAGLVEGRCPLLEAQQFLERCVAEDDALEFVALLKKHAWAECGVAVRKREVERILSVPPDRTTRNMLQAITGGTFGLTDELPTPVPAALTESEPPSPAQSPAATTARRTKRAGTTPHKAHKATPRPSGRAAKPGRPKTARGAAPARSRKDGRRPARRARTA
jgi:endonuclease III